MNKPTSLYLDLIRPLAALAVLLSHVTFDTISGGRIPFMASAGGQAVDVFFVLSGFVIAYVCDSREHSALDYAASRAARIYSVAVPALLLTWVADAAGARVSPETYSFAYQPFSPGLWLRSMLFAGEQWSAHRFPGSNSAYWSLGFEVWYYAAFGVFLFAPRRWRFLATLAVLAFIGPKVAIMFPVWLMGVAVYRICGANKVGPRLGWWLLAAPLVGWVIFECVPYATLPAFAPLSLEPDRLISLGCDYLLGALFSLHLIGFSAVSHRFAPWLERHAKLIRWVAGATFSIYLVHLPLLFLISALSPWSKESWQTLAMLLTLAPAACFAFAEVSERRKAWWHNTIIRCTIRK